MRIDDLRMMNDDLKQSPWIPAQNTAGMTTYFDTGTEADTDTDTK